MSNLLASRFGDEHAVGFGQAPDAGAQIHGGPVDKRRSGGFAGGNGPTSVVAPRSRRRVLCLEPPGRAAAFCQLGVLTRVGGTNG